MHAIKLLAALCICLCFPRASFAWNAQGHMVVAQIAYNHLSPQVKARCDSLIAVPLANGDSRSTNFVTAGPWADDFKTPLGTGIEHYIDLAFSLDGTSTNGVGAGTSNVVQALNLCVATLQSSTASQTDQGASLRYLIHFVGDIQQPLHCSTAVSSTDKTGDDGGNGFSLQGTWGSLHSLWDGGGGYITNTVKRPLDAPSQSTLNAWVSEIEALYPYTPNPGTIPTFMNWAQEGQALAETNAYVGITRSSHPSSTYLSNVQARTRQCMAAGGHRLADLLTTLFTTNAVTLVCSPVQNGKVTFSWPTVAGRTYAVQYKTRLSDSTWTPLTNYTASGTSTNHSESLGPTQRFYRVVQ